MVESGVSKGLQRANLVARLLLLSFAALTVAGCDEADPAEAMLAARGGGASSPPPAAADSTPAATPGGGAGLPPGHPAAGGVPPKPGDPAVPGAPGADPAAEAPAEDVPSELVVLDLVEVKGPFDEFVDAGNYTASIEVEASEPTDYAVWEFIAYDANDKEAGRILQGVKIPFKSKKRLTFDNVYFLGKPARFIAVLTDKEAIRAGGGSAQPGGGSPPPASGGTVNPPAGGGAPPAAGGSPVAPPGGGGGDEGDE